MLCAGASSPHLDPLLPFRETPQFDQPGVVIKDELCGDFAPVGSATGARSCEFESELLPRDIFPHGYMHNRSPQPAALHHVHSCQI